MEEAGREAEAEPASALRVSVRCPFCHDDVARDASWVACAGCLARHHAECWTESGRCATCGDGLSLAGARRRPRARLAIIATAALVCVAGAIAVELVRGQREVLDEVRQLRLAKKEPDRLPRYLGESSALAAIHARAVGGDAAAMHDLGVALVKGDGVPPDADEARKWLLRAADAGSVPAMKRVAAWFGENLKDEHGDWKQRDAGQATFWWERAADAGDVEAMVRAGHRQSGEKARAWWRRAAELGDRDAMLALSESLLRPPATEGERAEGLRWQERALRALRAAGESGDAAAFEQLATIRRNGQWLVERNVREAVVWYERAADAGSVSAMRTLASWYSDNDGPSGKRDEPKAIEWYLRAGDKGDAQSLHYAGYFLDSGSWRDLDRAIDAYRRGTAFGYDDRDTLARLLLERGDLESLKEELAIDRKLWNQNRSYGARLRIAAAIKKRPELRVADDPS